MLEDFIKVNRLSAEIFRCSDAHTAAKASQFTGDAEAVAKSIVLVASDGQPVLVILLGNDKIDLQKIKAVLGVKDVRLATPNEVLEITGYEIGGVPPVSIYGIRTIMDNGVSEKQKVVCGGGDSGHLMMIKIREILDNVDEISVHDVKR